MDTASDNDSDEGSIGGNAANDMGIDLTGILFGNIDSEGKLVDDEDDKGHAFDAELRENLGSLSKYDLKLMDYLCICMYTYTIDVLKFQIGS